MIQAKSKIIKGSLSIMNVRSEAFAHQAFIPLKYSVDGDNVNPPIDISNIPSNTKSLAIIVDEPDAPVDTWVHWIAWNIPPVKRISENVIPGVEGLNDYRQHKYIGPCPPAGIRHYNFKVYALDSMITLSSDATIEKLVEEITPHITAYGILTGLYKKEKCGN